MTDETASNGSSTAARTDAAVADVLDAYSSRLETTDPLAALADLDDFGELIADSRIVGLGEATHGTREFFRLKHRLLRYLVVEHDLRVIALEANFPETLAIDEYVVHGRGDPADALADIYFWTWNVDSVLSLIEWLREFNEGRPLGDRVRFYGVDAQYTTGAVDRLGEYFDAVGAALPAAISEGLETVDDDGTNPDQDEHTEERIVAGERLVSAVRDHLDDNRRAYVAREGERAWRLAHQHATVIEQATAYRQARADRLRDDTDEVMRRLLRQRDRAMAETVEWLLDHEDAERIAVWAHDAHVNRSKHVMRGSDVSETPMGGYLAERHEEAYVALGFAFGRGSFQALSEVRTAGGEGTPYELRGQTLSGPLANTIDATLDTLAHPLALVNVRDAREDERLREWLSEPRRHFSAGATYDPETPEEYVTEYAYGTAFDAVCFVAETTRARPVDEETPE